MFTQLLGQSTYLDWSLHTQLLSIGTPGVGASCHDIYIALHKLHMTGDSHVLHAAGSHC